MRQIIQMVMGLRGKKTWQTRSKSNRQWRFCVSPRRGETAVRPLNDGPIGKGCRAAPLRRAARDQEADTLSAPLRRARGGVNIHKMRGHGGHAVAQNYDGPMKLFGEQQSSCSRNLIPGNPGSLFDHLLTIKGPTPKLTIFALHFDKTSLVYKGR